MFEQQVQPIGRLAHSVEINDIFVRSKFADRVQVPQKLALVQRFHVVGHNVHLTRLIVHFAAYYIAKLPIGQYIVYIQHQISAAELFV